MRHWSRKSAWLAGAAAVALLFTTLVLTSTASPPQAAANAAAEDKTLTVGLIDPTIDSLNPFTTYYRTVTSIHRLMYDFLTNYTAEDATPTEGLAETWEHSDDGLTWTYTIRDDSTFSDGKPVTAADVEYTYNTIMNDKSGAMANSSFVENFASVKATDEHTLEIKLKSPQATMEAIDIPIVPKHVWEKVDDPGKFSNEGEYPIVGNGPWILTDYKRSESLSLEANKDYWRGAPGFDKLTFRFYKDSDALVEALKKGEIAFAPEITGIQADALKNEDDIEVSAAVGKRFTGFTINPGAEAQNGEPIGDGHPALRDQAVRTAILHAIDRDSLVDRVYGGYLDPNGSYIPTRYANYHWEPEGDEVIGYDVEEANRILDEAGYEAGDDGIRSTPEGERLTFRQHYHSDSAEERQVAKFIEEWLAEIGIEVKSEPSDDIGGVLDSGEFDILWTGWTVNPDPDYIFSIQTCDVRPAKPGGDYQSDAYYCNEDYDRLNQEQRTELDPDKRADIVKAMQKELYDDGVVVILGYPNMLEAYRTDVIKEGSILKQPAENGNMWGQDGYWSWWSAKPASSGGDGGSGGDDSNTGMVLGVGLGALAVALAGGFFVMRRRAATAGERE